MYIYDLAKMFDFVVVDLFNNNSSFTRDTDKYYVSVCIEGRLWLWCYVITWNEYAKLHI